MEKLPIDHYFVLGLGSVTDYPLRAHVSSGEGHYGRSPAGTDFVLFNTDIRRRLVTVPLFDTLGIPFVEVSAMAFYDAARGVRSSARIESGEMVSRCRHRSAVRDADDFIHRPLRPGHHRRAERVLRVRGTKVLVDMRILLAPFLTLMLALPAAAAEEWNVGLASERYRHSRPVGRLVG